MSGSRQPVMTFGLWRAHPQYPGPMTEPNDHVFDPSTSWEWFAGSAIEAPAWIWLGAPVEPPTFSIFRWLTTDCEDKPSVKRVSVLLTLFGLTGLLIGATQASSLIDPPALYLVMGLIGVSALALLGLLYYLRRYG